jgi:hypothetical protein
VCSPFNASAILGLLTIRLTHAEAAE